MELRWTSSALDDLDQALEYIAQDDPRAAGAMSDRILEAAEGLTTYPNLGRAGRLRGTRELVVTGTPFLLVYRVHLDEVQVLRMLHHARSWRGN
ncbi:MAG TPA: type II toxin-antitoxin system RelE/ParE family toxin [Myxococcaceae bacterium]|nr:type II toxin-antitoxin system RelE/ParE family toxin [Myxococcaceae bacterium]